MPLDHDLIVDLYAMDGLSTVAIAERLGCSKASVREALLGRGVTLRTRTQARNLRHERLFPRPPAKEWLQELMAEHNNNSAAAARAIEVNYWTFLNALHGYGIPVRKLGEAVAEACKATRIETPVEEAVGLSNQGMTYRELAEKYGVNYSTLAKRLAEAGHVAPPRSHRRKYDARLAGVPLKHRRLRQELGIYACQICGETRALDLAHIQSCRKKGPDDVRNCLVLCATHHRCFDDGTLTQKEFSKIAGKVRAAEVTFSFAFPHFSSWETSLQGRS